MGTWGSAAFENDTAEDWLIRLLEETDLFQVTVALNAVLDEADDLDADRCFEAVAAAEVVAASRGRTSRDIPEEVKDWLDDYELCADDNLASKGCDAVQVIRDHSEAAMLWAESPDWKRGLNGLIRRLRSPAKIKRPATRSPELPPKVAAVVKRLRQHRADLVFEKGQIRTISLDMIKGTDSDIDLILQLPNAPFVMIRLNEQISTEAFCRLSQSDSLEKLDLSSSPGVTDDVLKALASSSRLRELEVNNTPITDTGVAHLHALKDLQEFAAEYTSVSGEALVALQKRFPDCDIGPIRLLRSAGGKIPRRKSKPLLWEGRWPPN